MTDLEIIILAGGKGKRMGGEKPKVLTEVKGRPMISYVLAEIKKLKISEPILVLGYKADEVKQVLGDGRYALQPEQLGTGHAVACALPYIQNETETVMILYGDHPLVDAETIKNIYAKHQAEKSPVTLATIKVEDFLSWRAPFYDFGRIVRDYNENILKIVEKKDSSELELQIKEVNPSYFCFDKKWLVENIKKLSKQNAQGEYYLTDLIGLAQSQGYTLNSCLIETQKALGINTPEQLALVLKFI